MDRDHTLLKSAALVEVVSLLVLLTNLVTVHNAPVASLTGPVHGCAYLVAIGSVFRDPLKRGATVALAFIPGVGATLALRQLSSARKPAAAG
ncbi:DUF3817 domain-containing protein [Streptomyces fuscigenes]|uniref:DUF3817 domain-containing protein n=1 Tax=Streptomyces fuscigenes TaxID=1528880 RepID=UPI001F1D0A4C|nr:DUF3817 domain-containing protein [Streptomyces fuscigenes]MCF3961471.1 DUF3817 domain-containing protein [Streptomyces fuscigenes]